MPSSRSRKIEAEVGELFRSPTIASHQRSSATQQAGAGAGSRNEEGGSILLDTDVQEGNPEDPPPGIIRG